MSARASVVYKHAHTLGEGDAAHGKRKRGTLLSLVLVRGGQETSTFPLSTRVELGELTRCRCMLFLRKKIFRIIMKSGMVNVGQPQLLGRKGVSGTGRFYGGVGFLWWMESFFGWEWLKCIVIASCFVFMIL